MCLSLPRLRTSAGGIRRTHLFVGHIDHLRWVENQQLIVHNGLRIVERRPLAAVRCVAARTDPVPTYVGSTKAPNSDVWELDYCSRPLLDVRGKKVWELLICDPSGMWVHSEYFPNNKINSTELKSALKNILAKSNARKPTKVLFFRGQMQTIISRALKDMDIKPVPSRRCFTLLNILNDRLENVYKMDERYSENATTVFQLDLAPPQPIADALRGEQWAFVQLPLSNLRDEVEGVKKGGGFGSTMMTGELGLSEETLIPGVAVFSRRAQPLAAWTNGLELACLKADTDRSCLLLEAGVRDRYRYGAWKQSAAADEEAIAWEVAKKPSEGLHFLAVQEDPDAPDCSGIWLLLDAPLPNV
jgi:hypothetical protein